jgi:hypothetical protein
VRPARSRGALWLHTAQWVRRRAGVRGTGAAGCCTQRVRNGVSPHVLTRCRKVLEARWRAWRSGRALCAAQGVRHCTGGRGAGEAGCCARRKRSDAVTHVAARCHEVLEAHRREWRSGGALREA